MADILTELLSNATDPGVRKQAFDVRNIQRQLENLGVDASLAAPRESMLMAGLNFLDKGGQAVRGVIDSALVRGDIFQPDVGLGIERAWQERTSVGDILGRVGFEPGIGRAIAGFAGDVFTDPLTWVTFGGGQAARAGGKALSKSGVAAKTALESSLNTRGVTNFIEASARSDKFFGNISEIAAKSKDLSKIAGSGSQAETILNKEILSRIKEISSDLNLMGILPSSIGAFADDVFKKPSVNIGLNIPFLGHLTGGNKSALTAIEAGPVIGTKPGAIKSTLKQIAKATGAVIKPQRVGGSVEIPPQVIEFASNLNSFAKMKLGQLDSVVAQVPVVGSISKATKAIAKSTTEAFQRVFHRKAIVGEHAYNLDLDLKSGIQAASDAAPRATFNKFKSFISKVSPEGKLVRNDEGLRALKEAAVLVDSQAMNPLRQLASQGQLGESKDLLNAIRNSVRGLENVDFSDLANLAFDINHEEQFRFGINAILQSPEYSDLTKDAIRTIVSGFDEIAQAERAAGLNTSFLEGYIPHRYSNLVVDKSGVVSHTPGGIKGAFMKERQYKTFSEAILDQGLAPKLDVLTLFRDRYRSSRIAIAKNNYNRRMFLELGTSLDDYKALIKDAELNPNGPSAQLLNQRGFSLPPKLSNEDRALMEETLKLQSGASKVVGRAILERGRSTEDLLADIIPQATEISDMSPEALNAAYEATKDFNAYVHTQMYKMGEIPKDAHIPQAVLGEIAGKAKIGNQEFVLPTHLADAVKENLGAKDFIRSAFGKTELGKKFLNIIDAASNFNKKLVTLPFPQYWTNNLIGDSFLKYFDGGIAALDPGHIVQVSDILHGKTALRTDAGHIIDKPAIERMMRQYGLEFSAPEMRELLDAAGKMDVDRIIAETGQTALQNMLKGNLGIASDQAADFMRDNFERFGRVSHFIHHLKRGSTAADAARLSQDALINYRDLSSVEQSLLRRMFFFYGWTSKATKKAIGSMIKQPGDLTIQMHAARALTGAFGGELEDLDARDKRLLASQTMLEQIALPLGKNAEGKQVIGRVTALPINTPLSSFSIEMPNSFKISELIDAAWDSSRRTIQKQFAATNPIINVAAQVATNKNLYFDKPLSADFLRKIPSFEAAAEKLNGYAYNAIPEEIFATIDDGVKRFLGGVPDGKGRMIIRPGAFWAITNLIPALGRVISTGNSLVASDVPNLQGLLQTGFGVKIEDQTPERNFLGTYKQRLTDLSQEASVRQRKLNKKAGI